MKDKTETAVKAVAVTLLLLSVSSCATVRLDPSNRAEQVSVTFDKTIK